MDNFHDCMTEKLRILQAEYDEALARLRSTLHNFFPDGLAVQVRPPYPYDTRLTHGRVVGRQENLLIRVALDERAGGVVVAVPWEDVLPLPMDEADKR